MTQVTEPFPIFYDDDGTPLDDGMIYVGQANQDPRVNPVTVYTDEARTIPIAQPIRTLGGRPAYQGAPINLYVAEAAYSIAVQNRFGTPIVSAPDAGLSVDDFSFIQTGAGAVAETVQTTLRRTVYASQYSSLQAAITANPGRDIILSPGVTTVGLLTIAGNNTRLIGSRACTLRRANSTAGNFITITGASCALIGFVIDGNRANQTYAYNVGEVLTFGFTTELRNLRVINAISHGLRAVGGAVATVIADNDIETCGDFGIFVNSAGGGTDPAYGLCANNLVQDFGIAGGGGGATASVGIGVRSVFGGWVISGNRVRQVTARTNDQLGIECWTDANNMTVVGNYVDMIAHGEFGLSVTGFGSLVSGNIVQGTDSYGIEVVDKTATVTGNIVRSPRGIGIAINLNSTHPEPGDIMSVTGNVVENTIKVTGSNAAINVSGDAGVSSIAIVISGNTVHGLSHGIVVAAEVTGCTITGNTCWNTGSGQAGIIPLGTDMTVSGNTIIRVAAAGTGNGGGIVIGGSGHLISGNRIAGNSRIDNGILINAGTTNSVIQGNWITGAGNSIFSNSSATSIVVRENTASSGLALNAANRATHNLNTSNGIIESQNLQGYRGALTVAQLAALSALSDGDWAYATDATATTYDSVVAGGGGNRMRVHRVGANWRIG